MIAAHQRSIGATHILPYVVCIWISVPGILLIRLYRIARKEMMGHTINESRLRSFSILFLITVEAVYLGIMFSLLLLFTICH